MSYGMAVQSPESMQQANSGTVRLLARGRWLRAEHVSHVERERERRRERGQACRPNHCWTRCCSTSWRFACGTGAGNRRGAATGASIRPVGPGKFGFSTPLGVPAGPRRSSANRFVSALAWTPVVAAAQLTAVSSCCARGGAAPIALIFEDELLDAVPLDALDQPVPR